MEKNSDYRVNLSYDNKKNSPRQDRSVECFRHFFEVAVSQLYMSDHDFTSTNVNAAGNATFDFDVAYIILK